jgi:hypothetical protein
MMYNLGMTVETFDKFLQERINLIQSVLGKKAAEYAKGQDRMHNFNVALDLAPDIFKTREDAIYSFLVKHLTSLKILWKILEKTSILAYLSYKKNLEI